MRMLSSRRPQIVYTIPYVWRLAGLVLGGFAVVFASLFLFAFFITRAAGLINVFRW